MGRKKGKTKKGKKRERKKKKQGNRKEENRPLVHYVQGASSYIKGAGSSLEEPVKTKNHAKPSQITKHCRPFSSVKITIPVYKTKTIYFTGMLPTKKGLK